MKVATQDALERLIRNLPSGKGQGAQGTAPGPNAFSDILETAARVEAGGESARADRDRLAALLELVRIGMSRSVMAAFSPGGGEASVGDVPFMPVMTGPILSGQEASKVEHPHPRTDVQASRDDLDGIIDRASWTYSVERDLIVSVIRAESGFDPGATSPKGAMGLMQLMPGTARDLGVTDAYDPEQNIMAGTRYLRGLLDRYDGDVRRALAAYNWGMGNLERSTGGLPGETRNYIARIMKDLDGSRG